MTSAPLTIRFAAGALVLAACASPAVKGRDAGSAARDGDVEVRGQGGLFSVCLAPAECQPGLICTCGGVCTIPCRADECGALDAGAMCPATEPITGGCDTSTSGCVRTCATADDCAALGPTAICFDGWCRIPQAVTHVDGGAPSCDARFEPLQAQVEAAVAAADTSCQQDLDCVNISASNRCYGDMCPFTYVNAKAALAIEDLLATLDARCDAIFRAGCALNGGRDGCPQAAPPGCVAGHCGAKVPVLPIDGGLD
jgi:hypothetical protein